MHCVQNKLAALLVVVVLVGCEGSHKISENDSAHYAPAPTDNATVEPSRSTAKSEAFSKPKAGADASDRDTREPDATGGESKEFAADKAQPPRSDEKRAKDELQREQSQAGLLTAGSFDDHERLADYMAFVSQALQSDYRRLLPQVEFDRRVMIRVVNAKGQPIGDARIQVASASTQQTVLNTKSGSDGRALFLTGIDGQQASGEFVVTVTEPGQATGTTQTLTTDQPEWRIELHDAVAKLPTRLDIALVIDTTGSMRDELDYLKTEIDDIAQAVHKMFPNVDQRFALIAYRDHGDEYVTRTYDFTGSIDEFRTSLGTQHARGGGDYPEAMHVALDNATQLSWRDNDTARVLFLVGDAPPHDAKMQHTFDAVAKLRDRQVRMFPIAASGAQLAAEFVMRSAAFKTLGQYLFLTDHSGVGNPHAAPHVPSYLVEKLNRLMIRMIASELAGTRLAPQEVLAIERGELATPVPSTVDQQQSPHPENNEVSFRTSQPTAATRSQLTSTARYTILCLVVLGIFAFDATVGKTCRRSTRR